MTRHPFADRILRLYPRGWRDRYGDEVRDLVEELSSKSEFSKFRMASGLVEAALVQRVRSWRWSWRSLAVCGTVIGLVATLVIVLNTSGPSHPSGTTVGMTKGTIPSSTNGTIDSKNVPDFISALGRDGKIVGYIPRAYLVPPLANDPLGSKIGSVAPVYASNPKTLVGHMYPGVGFVIVGRSPASQPCIPTTTFAQAADDRVTTSTIACPSTVETVPNVIGSYLPTAMGQLSGESLAANISYVHLSSVSAGHVIRVAPEPGSRVPARSVVTVVSSLGPGTNGPTTPSDYSLPTSVPVPNTIGLTQAQACATLRASDLSCSAQMVLSSSVGTGRVLSQMPISGSEVESRSTVVIAVS